MQKIDSLIVIDKEVVPEIFIKVLDAKKMIARGEARSSVEACKSIGISRSAYYKYKDFVFSYEEQLKNRVITLFARLKDEPGILSAILASFYEMGANILTINQNIPMDSVASVTFTVRLDGNIETDRLMYQKLTNINGVIDIKIISGS